MWDLSRLSTSFSMAWIELRTSEEWLEGSQGCTTAGIAKARAEAARWWRQRRQQCRPRSHPGAAGSSVAPTFRKPSALLSADMAAASADAKDDWCTEGSLAHRIYQFGKGAII